MHAVKVGRTGSYVAACLGALAAIATAAIDSDDFSLAAFFAMLALDFLVGVVCGVVIKRGPPPATAASEADALARFAALPSNAASGQVDDNDGHVAMLAQAERRAALKGQTCERCHVRPVQAVLRKDDTTVNVCRRCVSFISFYFVFFLSFFFCFVV